jgi:hypothetical protein
LRILLLRDVTLRRRVSDFRRFDGTSLHLERPMVPVSVFFVNVRIFQIFFLRGICILTLYSDNILFSRVKTHLLQLSVVPFDCAFIANLP